MSVRDAFTAASDDGVDVGVGVVDAGLIEVGAEADDEVVSPVLRFFFGGRWESLWRVYFVVMRVCW